MGSIAPATLVTPHIPLPGSSQGNSLQARADTAYTTEWDVQEQATLDAALARYPADRHPPLERYVRAAAGLPKKNVRDVALRVAWMRATAAARKRKAADEANSKKQVRRERGQSIFAVQPKTMGGAVGPHLMAQHSMGLGMGVPPAANMGMIPGMPMPGSNMMQPPGMAYAQPVVPMAPPLVSQLDDHGAGTVGVVGGPLSQLLEQNYAILNQFKQNMEVYKVNENTELLVRFRDNILTVLNQMNAMQGVMQQMPPLPVRLNVELANNFLPKAVANGVCQMPYMAAPMHGMPPMPVTGQQGSAAMQQASMPYAAASSPAPGFAATHMAPQPIANGVSTPARAAAASAGLPAALPTSMPAASMPQAGVAAPGMLPGMGGLPAQTPMVKQEPAEGPVPIKLEPGLPASGSMPVGPAASAALFRPPPPPTPQPPSSNPMGPAGAAAVMPGTGMAMSSALPAAQLLQQQHQLQQPQQQALQQRALPIPAALVDPAKTPYNVLFPSSSAGQAAPIQEPSSSAGGLYDVLASITANTPGMLQSSAPQAFSASHPASAAPATVVQASQPQQPATPAAGMQQGIPLPGRAAAVAPLPYPVVQTGQLQPGMQEQQSMARSQTAPQGPPNSAVMPAPLPPSQNIPASAPLPYTAQVQGQAAAPSGPAGPSVPVAPAQPPPQQQQQHPGAPVQPANAAGPTAPASPAPPTAAVPESRSVPQSTALPASNHGDAQAPGKSTQLQPSRKAAPDQASQPAVAPHAQSTLTSAPATAAAKGTTAAAKPAASAPSKGATAPAQAAQPAQSQQPASKAAAAPAASAAPAQQEKTAAASTNTAAVSPQRAGPSVGTRRSSSALSPSRPQRATRSTAAKR